MSVGDLGGQFALDLQGLQHLKQTARQDPASGLKEASRQFEALFLQMMLKSMRDATPKSGLLDSQQGRFYSEMLDQQWSQQLAGHGLGLAEQLTQQLRRQPGVATDGAVAQAVDIPRGQAAPRDLVRALGIYGRRAFDATLSPRTADSGGRADHVEDFVSRLETPARAASNASGVPAELILAQAALETGWGRHQITTANGANSHNLFGIKAGADWQGPTTEVLTTEYVDGQPQQRAERFRVYPSFEAAFNDYAHLLINNPRYAGVVNAPDAYQAAYAMQRGGYATDPAYANKLIGVMRTIAPLAGRAQLAQL